MASLDDIRPVIGKELDEFEVRFRQSMKSSVPLLDKITYYLIKRRGKQLRPMLVFLSAGMHGNINDSTYRAASLIELLHTATLVHDDVVIQGCQELVAQVDVGVDQVRFVLPVDAQVGE